MRFSTIACAAALIACTGVTALPMSSVSTDVDSVAERDVDLSFDLDVRETDFELDERVLDDLFDTRDFEDDVLEVRKKSAEQKAQERARKAELKFAKEQGKAMTAKMVKDAEQRYSIYAHNSAGNRNMLSGVTNGMATRDLIDAELWAREVLEEVFLEARKKSAHQKAQERARKAELNFAKAQGKAVTAGMTKDAEQRFSIYTHNSAGNRYMLDGVSKGMARREFDDYDF